MSGAPTLIRSTSVPLRFAELRAEARDAAERLLPAAPPPIERWAILAVQRTPLDAVRPQCISREEVVRRLRGLTHPTTVGAADAIEEANAAHPDWIVCVCIAFTGEVVLHWLRAARGRANGR